MTRDEMAGEYANASQTDSNGCPFAAAENGFAAGWEAHQDALTTKLKDAEHARSEWEKNWAESQAKLKDVEGELAKERVANLECAGLLGTTRKERDDARSGWERCQADLASELVENLQLLTQLEVMGNANRELVRAEQEVRALQQDALRQRGEALAQLGKLSAQHNETCILLKDAEARGKVARESLEKIARPRGMEIDNNTTHEDLYDFWHMAASEKTNIASEALAALDGRKSLS